MIFHKSMARKRKNVYVCVCVCGIINGRILELQVAAVTGGERHLVHVDDHLLGGAPPRATNEESSNNRINWSLFEFERGKRPAFTGDSSRGLFHYPRLDFTLRPVRS